MTVKTETVAAPELRPEPTVLGLEPFRDRLSIPPTWDLTRGGGRDITVRAVAEDVRLHSQLPRTPMWTYEGSVPGPTIVVRRGQRLRINWANEIEGTIPFTGVQCSPGHVQHCEYPNDQQAATLWYHDHAMDITRLNVHAGMSGMYWIRDRTEDRLRLPDGRREIPLVIRDVNLDANPRTGRFTGELLYKIGALSGAPLPGAPDQPVEDVTLPMAGPYTMVNGKIWPHLDVEAGWYRFRMLNASNSRLLTLALVDEDGADVTDAMHLIGTDGGLLPAPATVPEDGLAMHASERFDVLIDFAALRGKRVRLTNRGAQDPLYPHIMEFRVSRRSRPDHFRLPDVLDPDYVRYVHDGEVIPDDHGHAFIALVPGGTETDAHPALWELAEVGPDEVTVGDSGVLQLTDPEGKLRTFVRRSKVFHDQNTIFLDSGKFAVWTFIHLGGPPHPMHVHMTEFQTLWRRPIDATSFDPAHGSTTTPIPAPGGELPLHDWELGMKDTFVIRPGTWQTIAGDFTGADGAFMYHCHILDHEDMGMMRPFMVRPPGVAAFDMHGHGGHHG